MRWFKTIEPFSFSNAKYGKIDELFIFPIGLIILVNVCKNDLFKQARTQTVKVEARTLPLSIMMFFSDL